MLDERASDVRDRVHPAAVRQDINITGQAIHNTLHMAMATRTMNADMLTTDAAAHLGRLLRSSFPPLDPNGQPLSMILRGASAELGELRLTLSTNPKLRDHLPAMVVALDPTNDEAYEDGEKFADGTGGISQTSSPSVMLQSGHEATSEGIDYENGATTQPTKRTRDGTDDVSDVENDDDDDDNDCDNEKLILYVPSVTCTCSSWSMEGVSGELFITTLRVLFLAKTGNDGADEPRNDVAIAGRYIALHAVDSLPTSDDDKEAEISHHIYCQLAEPSVDDDDVGYTPAMSMFAPSAILDEENENFNSDDDNEGVGDDNGSSEQASAIEVYFKPASIDGEDAENGSQSDNCQTIFDALTKLVSLNPEGEADDGIYGGGGGLLSMLSLMAGIGNENSGFDVGEAVADDDDDDDDDMVVRLGGSNNIISNDDESVGATNEARQAMLRRLDDMLVVPPEYEIASSTGGQFDDAEDDEDDDDEIL